MTLRLYRLKFQSAHFGEQTLESSLVTIPVERLFSALFLEALKQGNAKEWLEMVQNDDFVLTDTMLYNEEVYLPRPIGYPLKKELEINEDVIQLRQQAKNLKKIKAIPWSLFDSFVKGELTSLNDKPNGRLGNILRSYKTLYKIENVTRKSEDPYRVSKITYSDDTYLSFIASKSELLESLLNSLQYHGIGGKRSSGFGLFNWDCQELPRTLSERITTIPNQKGKYMLLNSALMSNCQKDVLEGATYLLSKSSGFAYSLATKENYRKRNVYKFTAGSCFMSTFSGKIIDVSSPAVPHPVWHYAKPVFLRMEVES